MLSYPAKLICLFAGVVLLVASGHEAGAQLSAQRPAEFAIFGKDGKDPIGQARYQIVPSEQQMLITGEQHYANGEHDLEKEQLELASPDERPALVSFEHSFFSSDDKPLLVARANLKSGEASCVRYNKDGVENLSATLKFPADTYAGASVLLPIVYGLRTNARQEVHFDVFNCVPGPRVVAVEARANKHGRWRTYPSEVTRVRVRPDLGWFNLLAGPFLPKFYAWFDPGDDWNYVGGTSERYYKGPVIQMLRSATTQVSNGPAAEPSAAIQPSDHAAMPTPESLPGPDEAEQDD